MATTIEYIQAQAAHTFLFDVPKKVEMLYGDSAGICIEVAWVSTTDLLLLLCYVDKMSFGFLYAGASSLTLSLSRSLPLGEYNSARLSSGECHSVY